MRVVLDTNVLVSALITPGGPCDQVVSLVSGSTIRPCLDGRILAEYDEVLGREELPVSGHDAHRLLNDLRQFSDVIPAPPLGVPLPHESDRPFLEVAHAVGATLVTGNLRHYPKRARAGVAVLTPGELLDLLREKA